MCRLRRPWPVVLVLVLMLVHLVFNDRRLLTSKALAGTLTTRGGRRLTFAFFVNNVPLPADVTTSREGRALGHLCEILHEHAG